MQSSSQPGFLRRFKAIAIQRLKDYGQRKLQSGDFSRPSSGGDDEEEDDRRRRSQRSLGEMGDIAYRSWLAGREGTDYSSLISGAR